MFTYRFHSRVALVASCAAALLLVSACQNVPKYKHGGGKFDEWKGYRGSHFEPVAGKATAIDTQAGTITIGQGSKTVVFAVTPSTRIMHETEDIPLAQLPPNSDVYYTLSEDGKRLLSVWYGHKQNAVAHRTPGAQRTTYF